MARRRGADATVSFFAFQDVMLGVIGIIILLTIVLLLQRATGALVESGSLPAGTAPPVDPPRSTPVLVETTIREPSASERAVRRIEIRELESELIETTRRLDDLRRAIREQADRLALGGQAHAVRNVLDRVNELEGELAALERRRRVTYLMADADGWTPLVIEISNGRAVVSRQDGDAGAFAIPGATASELATRIDRYVRAELRDREYLLLVVKPSGIETFFKLPRAAWDDAGLRVGLDLIPDSSATTDAFPAVAR